MCREVRCRTCGKRTWAGCGKHVDQVMDPIPVEQRCTCPRETTTKTGLLARLRGSR